MKRRPHRHRAATLAAWVRHARGPAGAARPRPGSRGLRALRRSWPAPHRPNGARLVARASARRRVPPRRLLADANRRAARTPGCRWASGLQGAAAARWSRTPRTSHNVIVCTLCSCYPIALLGPSPTWYKSEAYRSQVDAGPARGAAQFGFVLGPAVIDQRPGFQRGVPPLVLRAPSRRRPGIWTSRRWRRGSPAAA